MNNEVQYAGFLIRAFADMIDSIILDVVACVLEVIFLGLIYWIWIIGLAPAGVHPAGFVAGFFGFFDAFFLQIVLFIIRGVLSFIYYSWGTFRYETTVGKRIFRISVVSAVDYSPITLKQSVIRCLSYMVSYAPLGAGFLMVAFHPRKLALHDLIAGTVSVIKSSPRANNS